MDYFRKYMSNPNSDVEPSGADIVERLVERVNSSTLIEDRQDALRALKSLSKKYRLDVGTQSMLVVLDLLENYRGDHDIAVYCLDILYNILNDDDVDVDRVGNMSIYESVQAHHNEQLGKQFTEMLMKKTKNIACIVGFLDEFDFSVRRSAMHLITLLLKNRTREVQDCILMCPTAISKIMDLMSDLREVIRNDSILLLQQLTFNNTNIQKIVAFENAFERIVSILREEGYSDGGVVVEDCLRLLWQLLKNNPGNQTLFKESQNIQKLSPFFDIDSDQPGSSGGAGNGGGHSSMKIWSSQKITNFILILQVLRTLISPSNKFEATVACQKVVYDSHLIHALCSILMASGIPAEVLTETIHTVAECIRGYAPSQQYVAGVMAPSDPPEPAINVLLLSMVNDRQPFPLRQSVLYCLQCFLYKNVNGQKQTVETLLPKTVEETEVSTGQLLCTGLFSQDPLSVWFAAMTLSHAIHGNSPMKEEMLRVHLAISLSSRPIGLLHQLCILMSEQTVSFQSKVGILTLLCTWLYSCPAAVRNFLQGESDCSTHANKLDCDSNGCPTTTDTTFSSQQKSKIGSYISLIMSELASAESEENDCILRGLFALLLSCAILYNSEDIKGYESSTLIHIVEKRVGRDVFLDHLGQVGKTEAFLKANKKSQPCYKESAEVVFDYEFTLLYKRLDHEIYRRFHELAESKSSTDTKVTLESLMQLKTMLQQKEDELNSTRIDLSNLQMSYSALYNQFLQLNQELQKVKDHNLLLKAGSSAETSHQSTVDALTAESHQQAAHISQLEREIMELKSQLMQSNANDAAAAPPQDNGSVMSLREYTELQGAYSQLYQGYEDLLYRYNECEKEKSSIRQEHEDLLVLLADQDANVKELKQTILQLGGQVELDDEEDDPPKVGASNSARNYADIVNLNSFIS